MARLGLTLLGGFQARLDSGQVLRLPTRKAQALLAYLAIPPGQAHPRDKLAALLWGGIREESARASLRQALFAIRKALGATSPPALLTAGENLGLNPVALDIDVAAFERLVAEGTPGALEQAATLYHGDLLAGLSVDEPPFEEWLVSERERLRELALDGLAKLLVHQRKAGAGETAIQTALKLLALDPLQEPVRRTLMRLYAEQGRRGAALRQYQACVAVLQRELGVEPEGETKQLYQEILNQRPSPRTVVATSELSPAEARETPIVGRDSELMRLGLDLEAAWSRQGRLVEIRGEAGIGKTRLVEELAELARQRGGRVLLGRAYESERILPFGPWVEALRGGQLLDASLVEGLGATWRAELARLFPELAGSAPPSAEASDERRLFEAVTRLVIHMAARRPLVVILEDLHWADDISLRLLAFLGRRVQGAPTLLVGTVRDEELVVTPRLLQVLEELRGEDRLVELALVPLSRPALLSLVRALARVGTEESVVERLGEQVWTFSEGNPFMAVETMRALREGMSLGAPSHLPIPQRVREVIEGRLTRLGARARELAAVAAVVGRELDFPLLPRAAGLGEPEAAEAVEELVRRRILRGAGERLDFSHDRIREVVYAQVLPPRRTLLHRQVAQALEALYAEDLAPHYAALGFHYGQGEAWAKATEYFRRAGAQAATRTAHVEAVGFYEQALAALGRLPRTPETPELGIDLRCDIRNSLHRLARLRRGFEYLREAEDLARALGDQRRLGGVLVLMSQHFWMTGYPADARRCAETARAIAGSAEDFSLWSGATFYLGTAHQIAGEPRRGEECFREILQAIEPSSGRAGVAAASPRLALGRAVAGVMARNYLAFVLAEQGAFDEAIACGEEGLRLAEALDRPLHVAQSAWAVGRVYALRGDFDRAATAYGQAVTVSGEWNLVITLLHNTAFLGYARALAGRLADGLALLEEGVAGLEAMELGGYLPLCVAHLGEARLLAGELDAARTAATRAHNLARQRGERGYEAYACRLLGDIDARVVPRGCEDAAEHYCQALALATELGMRPLEAHCRLGLGRVTGDRAEVAAAVELYRALDMPFWLSRAEGLL